MDYSFNAALPYIMHIDLNSCFAMIEQQANPLLRNRPVAVAAYDTPRGIILAASYEAKALGIKLGVTVADGRKMCPGLVVLMPDPEKYFDAHRRFKQVLLSYTNEVVPKSVDEFVVDFRGSPALRQGKTMQQIGYDIKDDIKQALGEYVTVNVGIGPNRFLAKLAAGLNKPDGLDTISHENLRQTYENLSLLDLPGINKRYKARLNLAGIFTPLEFLDAPMPLLKKQVFKSIVGYYWFLRLRGHEIDAVSYKRRSFGHQYALGQKTANVDELSRLLMKLCEKTGRRLRAHSSVAYGVHLWLSFESYSNYSHGSATKHALYSTHDIYLQAQKLLYDGLNGDRVTNMSITVYNLRPFTPRQQGLFDDSRLDTTALARAGDIVNDRYGEFTLTPAIMANMQDVILKRVAFGSID